MGAPDLRYRSDKMKTFALFTIAAVNADDKKVPPRHPLNRLNKLNSFANEWCRDNLSSSEAANWGAKFDRNTARFERRYELCGFYDENHEHGGPRERHQVRSAMPMMLLASSGTTPATRFAASSKSRRALRSGRCVTLPIASFNRPDKSLVPIRGMISLLQSSRRRKAPELRLSKMPILVNTLLLTFFCKINKHPLF